MSAKAETRGSESAAAAARQSSCILMVLNLTMLGWLQLQVVR